MKNKKRIASVLLASAIFATSSGFAMPDLIRIVRDGGEVVEYNINEAIENSELLKAMNGEIMDAFGKREIVGNLSDGKLIDVGAALSSDDGYEKYESDVKSEVIAEATDITADKKVSVDEEGNITEVPAQKKKCETLLYKLAA